MADRNIVPETTRLDKHGRRRIVAVYGTFVLYALLLFASAGTLRWTAAWAYLGASVIVTSGVSFLIPDMARVINARGRNTRPQVGWDRIIMSIYAPLMLSQYILAGLDAARFGWTSVGLGWRIAGWAFLLGSMAIVYWAMGSNPYLETTVRIQTDRGQTVTDRGPYRWVRHPMYVGMIASLIGTPWVLGSWWALIPGILAAGMIIARTAREDAMLQRELGGYTEYAQRTRARLLPGVW